MATKSYTLEELRKIKDQTDYERLRQMTDEEIEENAKSDPDCLPPH